MVRNIVGSLIQVGKGKCDADWLRQVLESRDRKLAAPTFMPDGLYLERVSYAARWALPEFAPSALDLLAPAHLAQTIAP